MTAALPYLTRGFAGIGGTIKNRPDDFFVQEIPLYEPSGEGEHVYCEIQKVGLTTFEAVSRVAKALGVPSRSVGYAGMKDAHAVSRQVLSVAGTTEQAVMSLRVPDVTVLWAARHGNKLRLGHLKGNRFAIKIRGVEPTDVLRVKPVIETLKRRGMPNYFGEQRFGRRGDNDKLGALLVRGDDAGLLAQLLGSGEPAGGMERAVQARLAKTGNPTAAVKSIDEKIRRLWVSALQSRLFNDVLARRVDSIDVLQDGDLAYKHENGACFKVESAAAEQPRCDAFEISPTGPLLGCRMSVPDGQPLQVEQELFAAAGLSAGDFRNPRLGKVRGARRPLRVRPEAVDLAAGVDDHGAHATVAFTLPAGSFATVFLRELMKADNVTCSEPPPR